MFEGLFDPQPEAAPRPIRSAQVATLKEAFAQYGLTPFAPGDLVTPRKGYGIRDAGEPHIVMEVAAEPWRTFEGTHASNSFGARLDIRVACVSSPGGNMVAAFWAESWMYERYEEVA